MQTAGILPFGDLPEMVCLENPVDRKGLVCAALLNAAWYSFLWCFMWPKWSFGSAVTIWGTNIDYLVSQTCRIFSRFALISTILCFYVFSDKCFGVAAVSKLLIFCHSEHVLIQPSAFSLWSPGILLHSRVFLWESQACLHGPGLFLFGLRS